MSVGVSKCCYLWLFLLLLPLQFAVGQTSGEGVVQQLVDMGFTNVRFKDAVDERIYTLECEAYKQPDTGIREALKVIQRQGLDRNRKNRVIVTHYNVPQVALTYQAQVSDSIEAQLSDWKASYEVGDSWNKVKKEEKQNSSLYKVDLVVYPQLAFENLVITQIYYVLFDLSPALEVSLWPGMKLSAMLKIPVYNDGYGIYEGKVHPGMITISQRFRLPYEIQGRVTAGYFNSDRYGVDVRLKYPFKDPRFSLTARAGLLGIGYWDGMHIHYDTNMSTAYSLEGSFYWPQYHTQFILRAEKWLRNDRGLKFEMIRHFKYTSIGFYAMKATDKGASANGGFRVQVALPPYRNKRHKNWPRINTSSHMGIVYNAGNEQYYYKEYKAEASDNIMEANSFNPLFIQRELK